MQVALAVPLLSFPLGQLKVFLNKN